MPLLNTKDLRQGGFIGNQALTPFDQLQIYNTIDCCVTYEANDEISSTHSASAPIWSPIYDFERALQAPYLSIMRKGFRVNEGARWAAQRDLKVRISALQEILDELSISVCNRGLNPRSPQQLANFFYGTEGLRLPEQRISVKGIRRVSTGREALERLDDYLYARPFVNTILSIRDLGKQLEVFETAIDDDGRFRAAYNIAGTETGRPSSSENAFGTGRNAQNIAPGLRYVFEADEGKRMCVIDLEQVEARDEGYFIGCLFNDWTLLDNAEKGDLHTNNCKLIWPAFDWTEDKKHNRELADQIFYREFTHRDMSKRGGHLTNYKGTAGTMARSLKIPLTVAEEFQARYCRGGEIKGEQIIPAFPGIPKYWNWVATELQTKRELTTPFGRRRHFFGRPGDDATLREAIAFLPQSTTADRMNLGLWRIWKHMPEVELLAQTYDSVTFQFSEELDENKVVQRALGLVEVELTAANGRRYVVPGEAKVGWNWGAEQDREAARKAGRKIPRGNPDGLRKWSSTKRDERIRSKGGLMGRDLEDFGGETSAIHATR